MSATRPSVAALRAEVNRLAGVDLTPPLQPIETRADVLDAAAALLCAYTHGPSVQRVVAVTRLPRQTVLGWVKNWKAAGIWGYEPDGTALRGTAAWREPAGNIAFFLDVWAGALGGEALRTARRRRGLPAWRGQGRPPRRVDAPVRAVR